MAPEDLIDLDEALDELGRNDPVKAKLVTLRYFGGLTIEEAAEVCGISRVTAHRYWRLLPCLASQETENGRHDSFAGPENSEKHGAREG